MLGEYTSSLQEDESGVGGDDSVGSETMEVFSTYVASAVIDRGVPHPGEIAEASSLRCQNQTNKREYYQE